jgi:DNA-binding response OmpR family regulator
VARRKKILIVEDNNDWRDLLAKFINRLGYDFGATRQTTRAERNTAPRKAARPNGKST